MKNKLLVLFLLLVSNLFAAEFVSLDQEFIYSATVDTSADTITLLGDADADGTSDDEYPYYRIQVCNRNATIDVYTNRFTTAVAGNNRTIRIPAGGSFCHVWDLNTPDSRLSILAASGTPLVEIYATTKKR